MQAWVHPAGQYPDVFGSASSPIKLSLGHHNDVVLTAQSLDFTDGFRSLSYVQRKCLLESETPELQGFFTDAKYMLLALSTV